MDDIWKSNQYYLQSKLKSLLGFVYKELAQQKEINISCMVSAFSSRTSSSPPAISASFVMLENREEGCNGDEKSKTFH